MNISPASIDMLKIGQVCRKVTSGGTPSRKEASFFESGTIPWVKTKELRDKTISETEEYITEIGLAKSSAKLLPAETVLMAMIGATVGKLGVLGVPAACNQNSVALIVDEEKAHFRYLFYALLSQRERLVSLASGGAQAILSAGVIKELELPFPDLKRQHVIGRVLHSLDSMIELNSKMAQTLEDVAQTIFKSWFIDFDPVHAKSRGEQPEGMDAETAALFPDGFEESELGLIPSTFRVSRFDSFAEIQLGGTPSKAKAEYWDGSIPWINSGAVNEFRITQPTRYITELGLRKSSCKVLPKGTTVVAITGATLGQFSRVELDTTANQSVIGITTTNSSLNNFVYLWMAQNIEQLISKATGGAQQHINRNDVCEQLAVLPSPQITSKFDELVDPMFSTISNLMLQKDTLVQIRDSLLPRLISGDLEIPEELMVD